MLLVAFAYLAGLLTNFYADSNYLHGIGWSIAAILLLTLLLALKLGARICLDNANLTAKLNNIANISLLASAAYAAGFYSAAHSISSYQQQQLGTRERNVELVIKIEQIALAGARLRFNARVLQVLRPSQTTAKLENALLRLNWYQRHSPLPELSQGQVWRLQVTLKPVHGMYNNIGFDYEQWLFANDVHASGYVHSGTLLSPAQARQFYRPNAVVARIAAIRNYLFKQLQQSRYQQGANLVQALVLGARQALPAADFEQFKISGTAHLFAISGLHVAMVASIFWLVSKVLFTALLYLGHRYHWRPILRRVNSLKPQKIYISTALLASLGYALLAGMSIPTQRAFIMLLVVYVAVLLRARAFSLNNLAIAMLLVLAVQPKAVLSIGFWLSFAATFWVIMLIQRLHFLPRRLQGSALALIIPALLYPLNLYFFGASATLAASANLWLIPLIGLVVLPLALLALIPIDFINSAALYLIEQLYTAIMWLLRQANALDIMQQSFAQISWWQLLLYQVCSLALLLALSSALSKWQKWRAAAIAPRELATTLLAVLLPLATMLLAINYPSQRQLAAGNFQLQLLDVDQGLSAIVSTAQHTLVFDTGASFGERDGTPFYAASNSLLPLLRANQFGQRALSRGQLDSLIISHNDNDHRGGLPLILQNFKVEQLLVSAPLFLNGAKLASTRCQAGMTWQWDGVSFAILSPQPGGEHSSRNDNSCVLKISGRHHSVLLTGDISSRVERQLLQSNSDIAADFLLLAHHGSSTSSSWQFLQAVKPRAALAAAGFYNRFGHPAQVVRERLLALEIPLYISADCGLIEVDSTLPQPSCSRRLRRANWYQQLFKNAS